MRPSSSAPRPLAPAGGFKARCIYWIDLGTQETTWKGEKKQIQQVKIGFELLGTKHVFDEQKGPQPFVISQDYTNSIGDTANLRKMLKGWRGKDFTPEELKKVKEEINFLGKLFIGKPAFVQVVHEKGKSDPTKSYARLSSVIKYDEEQFGGPCPKAENFPLLFDIEDTTTHATFEKLPKFFQDQISKCPEWNLPPSHNPNPLMEEDDKF